MSSGDLALYLRAARFHRVCAIYYRNQPGWYAYHKQKARTWLELGKEKRRGHL